MSKTSTRTHDIIIDMEPDEKGTFHAVTPYRRPSRPVYRGFKVSPFYQFLDGFIIGLEAIERFIRFTERFSRKS